VEVAVGLAEDLSRLTNLRASLRGEMERSPLRDPIGLTRDLEAAYMEMVREIEV
jgi:predicted O-linked N-acetylglucosamine transferase (SPINDLY family)